jgi:hypothetical protein
MDRSGRSRTRYGWWREAHAGWQFDLDTAAND